MQEYIIKLDFILYLRISSRPNKITYLEEKLHVFNIKVHPVVGDLKTQIRFFEISIQGI